MKINVSKSSKKLINIALGLMLIFSISSLPILAQEESSASSESSQNLRERIERVVKEKSEEVQEELENISYKKQGFIGLIERVSNESISIKTNKDTRILAVDEEVNLIRDQKSINLEDIAVGDWATVMGLIIDDSFVPRRILFSSESIRPRDYSVILGTITQINKNSVTIKSRTEETYEVNINKTSSLQDFEANKISQSEIEQDQQVLAIIYSELDEEEETESKYLKVLRVLSLIETQDEQ